MNVFGECSWSARCDKVLLLTATCQGIAKKSSELISFLALALAALYKHLLTQVTWWQFRISDEQFFTPLDHAHNKDKKTKEHSHGRKSAIPGQEHRSGDNLGEYFLRDPVEEKVGRHSIMSFILIGPEETAIISDSHQRAHPKISFDFFLQENSIW